MPSTSLLCLLVALLVFPFYAFSQIVSPDVLLQGDYVEVGISECGVYATGAPPDYVAGPIGAYHPTDSTGISSVADTDLDGWIVGFPQYCGDYFLAGTPVEGWAIQLGSTSVLVYKNTDQYCDITDMPGSITSYNDFGTFRQSMWEGAYTFPSGDSLLVYQETTLPVSGLYFLTEVTLCNQSVNPLFEVYYLRNVDPDNEQYWSGNFTTRNEIELQFPMDTAAVISAIGYDYGCYFAYASGDPRARVSYGGFDTGDPFDAWNAIPPHSGSGMNTADEAVQLSFKIDVLPPGDCSTMLFAHAFSADAVTETIEITSGPGVDILVDGIYSNGNVSVGLCEDETTSISIVDPNLTGISWSPTTGLSTASGPDVDASPASTEIYTYTGMNMITGQVVTGTVTVNVLPLPLVDAGPDVIILAGESAVLTATGALNYSWSPTGDTSATTTVSPTMITTYEVLGVDANGCVDNDAVTVFVDQSNGLQANSILPILVYPNPLSTPNALIVSHPDMLGEMEVQLFNGVGKLVYTQKANSVAGKLDIAVPEVADGIYHLLVVGSDGATFRNSLVIE